MSQITTITSGGGGGGGVLVQQVSNMINTQILIDDTVATPIPYDNTIPQITEGVEIITATITPTDANNILYIRVESGATNGQTTSTIALFQDANPDAISARNCNTALEGSMVILTHRMVANTLAATTFSVRCGMESSGTGDVLVINGDVNNNPIYGGVSNIIIYIYEMTP